MGVLDVTNNGSLGLVTDASTPVRGKYNLNQIDALPFFVTVSLSDTYNKADYHIRLVNEDSFKCLN